MQRNYLDDMRKNEDRMVQVMGFDASEVSPDGDDWISRTSRRLRVCDDCKDRFDIFKSVIGNKNVVVS